MEFRILGPLEVLQDGRPVPLGGAKQRALLAILLLNANDVVSRDRLIDDLWGGSPPDTAQTALQVHVSQLRKVLGRETIVTRAPGYAIQIGPGELDLDGFERLVDEARRQEPAEAATTLRNALALWRGTPLAEFDSAEFADRERGRLEEQRLAALEQRIEADLALGRHAAVVTELEALVREHPLRERVRAQLMRALYRSGRQADALEVYRSGRRLLDEELGLEPGEELRRLERAILEQDPSLAPADSAPPAIAAVPTGTVTFLFTDIEGSTRLVQALGDDYGALLEHHHRLVREALVEYGGQEIDTQGDAFFFAFRRARDAVRGAVRAQLALPASRWPHDVDVRIRIGIHTGEPPGLVEGGYHGLDVVRAARISGAAHGGQILVSSATRDLAGEAVPEVSFRDLGEHRLKDIEEPQRIFQVVAPGLPEEFPALRTQNAARVMTIGGREEELAAAAEAALETEERRVRLFRHSRVVALAGALLVAGAVAGVVIALTRGSGGSVAVSPNSVAIIDPKTNQVVGDVPVGSRPVAVAVGKDAVWVANADDGTISRIDANTRKVTSTIGIGADVSDVAVGFGSVWVANGNDGTLARIDPQSNAVERTLSFGGASDLVPQPVFSVAVGAGAVWITRGNRVLRIDPRTNELTKSVPVEPPLGLTVGAGSVWVTTRIDHVLRIDSRSGAATTFSLPTFAIAPTFGGGFLWVILANLPPSGNVWALNPDTGDAAATTSGGDSPSDLAFGDRVVWSAAARAIVHIGDEARPVATIPLAARPTGIAVGDGAVWVTVESPS